MCMCVWLVLTKCETVFRTVQLTSYAVVDLFSLYAFHHRPKFERDGIN